LAGSRLLSNVGMSDEDDYADDAFEDEEPTNDNTTPAEEKTRRELKEPTPMTKLPPTTDTSATQNMRCDHVPERSPEPQVSSSASSESPAPAHHNRQSQTSQQRQFPSDFYSSSTRKYRVSVDLRSVRGIVKKCHVFLRYSYPLFRAAPIAPLETEPDVEVQRGKEVMLPNGFCSFEFQCTRKELETAFRNKPLIVQVFKRLKNGQREELGIVRRDLDGLLSAPVFTVDAPQPGGTPSASISGNSSNATLQAVDNYCTIYRESVHQKGIERVGSVRIILTLEDFGSGVSPDSKGKALASSAQIKEATASTPQAAATSEEKSTNKVPQIMGYQLAWELEMWRRAEEKRWENIWKKREKQRAQELEAEFQKQLAAREEAYEQRTQELGNLEKKLKHALFECERQEKALKNGESALEEHKKKLHRDYEAQGHETMLALKRLKDQHKHEMSILKLHNTEIKQQNKVLKKRIETLTASKKAVEMEFQRFKQKMDKSQVAGLRQKITEKDLEIKEVRQDLRGAKESEARAKAHLRKCLEEIVRLRRLRDADHEKRLKMEEKEIARLRAAYTRQQRESKATNMRNELLAIKQDLYAALGSGSSPQVRPDVKFKLPVFEAEGATAPSVLESAEVSMAKEVPLVAPMVGGAHKHATEISRLEAERRDLLNSGVYLADHPMVERLASRIQALAQSE